MRSAPPLAHRISTCALVALFSLGANAASAEDIAISSIVTAATIYPDGASVTRSGDFTAPAGRHHIILEDAPEHLDPSSLRISGSSVGGAFQILSAERGFISKKPGPEHDAARTALQKQIEEIGWRRRSAEDARTIARDRIEYLRRFRDATVSPASEGKGGADLLAARESWSDAWSKLSAEAVAAAAALRAAEREIGKIAREEKTLRTKLAQMGPGAPRRKVLKIAILAEGAVTGGKVNIVYLTRRASWAPLYDLRLDAADTGAPAHERGLTISRRAAIRQRTGEDWTAVKLTLSTARPSSRLAGRIPNEMVARILPPPAPKGALTSEERPSPKPMAPASEIAPAEDEVAAGLSDRLDAAKNLRARLKKSVLKPKLAVERRAAAKIEGDRVVYELPTKFDVKGDGSTAYALVGSDKVKARLEARTAPALDKAAFLTAIVKMEAALPPGVAAIYRDGAYLGQTRLGFVAPGDEAELPFGEIEGLRIEHRVLERLRDKKGVFTTSNTNRERFRIIAKNLTKTPLPVVVYAAAPVTEDKRITIKLVTPTAPSDKSIKGRRGVVAWRFELAAGADRTLDYGWDLAWPEKAKVGFSRR
ncbi:MAG: mucoidy inhibitor MuiA family protein [Neomegalonema sp.]|nr:mucoidy inhibitor MuiA family protein [Neomegalonema sp.]